MFRSDPWPVLYGNILRQGNLESNVGIATLWTERDVVKNFFESHDYCVIGNLYAAAGINHIIRNVFANPNIRYIVLWGADMSQSGHAFLRFMDKGIDENYQIIDARGQLEKEIPRGAVETFRKMVQVIDMRGRKTEDLVETVRKLKKEKPFAKKWETFPPATSEIETFPSEQIGFRVEADKVAKTWLRILNLISRYGRVEKTRYASNNKLKEILNLTAVITDEDPENEYFPHYLPFSLNELKAYYPELLTSRRIPGTAYNYGARLRNMHGLNQIEEIKKLLKRRPFSKKLAMFTYDLSEDFKKLDESDTPCLTQVNGRVEDGKFILTAHFRSQDMFHGWPRNAFALRKLQKEIADYAKFPLGQLCLITHSAHMYADDWNLAKELIEQNWWTEFKWKPPLYRYNDPRSNWIIEIDRKHDVKKTPFGLPSAAVWAIKRRKNEEIKGRIIAKLYNPDMSKVLAQFEGRTAKEIFWQIADLDFMFRHDHTFSLGEELTKAEIALRFGLEFEMDKALDMSKILKS
ncbi:hypothetical protein HY345_04600 [Candidatus Microgenomates bacterium]|nr:hypothetical protein [Candidatus Microgenomates bacterium]